MGVEGSGEVRPDGRGGFNVGGARPGEWLAYTVDVGGGGVFDFEARVSSIWSGGQFHVECGGRDVTGLIDVPRTGHWQTYTTVERPGITLPKGRHVLRIVFDRPGTNGDCVCNLDRFTIRRVGACGESGTVE